MSIVIPLSFLFLVFFEVVFIWTINREHTLANIEPIIDVLKSFIFIYYRLLFVF